MGVVGNLLLMVGFAWVVRALLGQPAVGLGAERSGALAQQDGDLLSCAVEARSERVGEVIAAGEQCRLGVEARPLRCVASHLDRGLGAVRAVPALDGELALLA